MRYGLFTLLGVVVLAGPAAAQGGAEDALEKCVNKALTFLEQMQEADGSWRLYNAKNPTATALTVMAFLSAGHVPGEGKYGDLIEKGVRFVAEGAQPAGPIGPGGAL